jgi:CPA2 family monovalent cation:H+ antiporter-2
MGMNYISDMSHDIPMYADLLVIIGVSLPVLFLFRRLGLPPIAGFVLTGVLIGPYGLSWITSVKSVEVAAEVGVILLLFTIGLEFSLSRLLTTPIRLYLIAAGQIIGTSLLGYLASIALGLTSAEGIVIGFVLAVSSSAIVLKGLADRGELETPIGRMVVTICVVQDIAVVPMLLAIGFISAEHVDLATIGRALGEVVLLGAVVFALARYVLPWLLHRLMAIDAPEVVLLFTVLLLMGTAWAADRMGLSLALGAFAAGLILSDSEYYPQIYAEVTPFRTLFSSLFFISIGMLLDLHFVMQHPVTVIIVVLAVFVLKSLVVVLVSVPLGVDARSSIQSGFYVAQVGEFSFLLLGVATTGALITAEQFQYLIAASSVTLAVTPLIMQWAPRFAWRAGSRLTWIAEGSLQPPEKDSSRPKPAILVVGYGVNGHNVARVLREAGLYYEILDFNADTVRKARQSGELVHYGDITITEVLRRIDVHEFDSVVVAISDPAATRRGISIIRRLNPEAHLIVRTRHVAEVEDLARLGADVVVPEEFETSLRIFSDLLAHYRIPPHIIAAQIEVVRNQSYSILRTSGSMRSVENLHAYLLGRLVEVVLIAESRTTVGQTAHQLRLPEDGCTVISILRNGKPLPAPLDEVPIKAGDMVILYGDHAALDRAVRKLTTDRTET